MEWGEGIDLGRQSHIKRGIIRREKETEGEGKKGKRWKERLEE